MYFYVYVSMGTAKYEQASVFRRKKSGLRFISAILRMRSVKKSTAGSFVGQLMHIISGN